MRHLVAYDVAADRRRRKLAVVLGEWGIRLQQSVFELDLEPGDLVLLQDRMAAVVDPSADIVQAFPACRACAARRVTLGTPPPGLDAECWIL